MGVRWFSQVRGSWPSPAGFGLSLYLKEIAPLGGISGDRPKSVVGIGLGKQHGRFDPYPSYLVFLQITYLTFQSPESSPIVLEFALT